MATKKQSTSKNNKRSQMGEDRFTASPLGMHNIKKAKGAKKSK